VIWQGEVKALNYTICLLIISGYRFN